MPVRVVIAVVAFFFALRPCAAQLDPQALRALRDRLDKRAAAIAKTGATFGIRIITLPEGEPIYSLNAEGLPQNVAAPGGAEAEMRMFAPASNMKLITTAAALDVLGSKHTFDTVFGLRGSDLVVVGSGDPAFGDPGMPGVRSVTEAFVKWAGILKGKGITQIDGSLLVDDLVFDDQFVHTDWPRDQLQEWYCAPVGGLNINTNCLDVFVDPGRGTGGAPAVRFVPDSDFQTIVNQAKTGGRANVLGFVHGSRPGEIVMRGTAAAANSAAYTVAVQDPVLLFAGSLAKVLSDNGIKVVGGIKRARIRQADGSLPADLAVLDTHKSALPDVLARCNKKSQNLYAECLFKAVGAAYKGDEAAVGTWARGSAGVSRFLGKLHLPEYGIRIADGSGMSRENAVHPMLVTEVLRHMYGHPHWETYRDSLAVAGVDGTLSQRMRTAGVKGNVFAKTGYIRGVSCLSGYARTPAGEWVAFSMLFNDIRGAIAPVKDLQDEVCAELTQLSGPARR